MRIKEVVDSFVKELRSAMEADMHDRLLKEREMKSYLEEREREVAEREAAWKADLSRREVPSLTLGSLAGGWWGLSSSSTRMRATEHDKGASRTLERKLLQGVPQRDSSRDSL